MPDISEGKIEPTGDPSHVQDEEKANQHSLSTQLPRDERASQAPSSRSIEVAPSYPNLPGFQDLVDEGTRQFEQSREVDALKYMYWEDVRQRKFEVLRHYLHLSDAKSTKTKDAWAEITKDLQQYSEAMERWQAFERTAHAHKFHTSTNERNTIILAARSWATEVYEDRYVDTIKDIKAARAALEDEKQRIAKGLRALPSDRSSTRTAAEREAARREADATRQRADTAALAREKRELFYKVFWARFFMALFGGVALIAPMLIMSLHNTRTTSLATTSVFTLVVAVLLAWFMKTAEAKDVMASTAAYAAVLVVFVGTATQPIASDDGVNQDPNRLSAGAIAGIVFGTIFGIFILMVLLTCLCCKGLIDGLFSLFGLRKRRRRTEKAEQIEEYYPIRRR